MPTYEYRCRACGHEFERFQSISDSPVRTCPSCKKRRVERLISAGGGLVFKGAGFYATDYRKGRPSGGSSDSADSSDSKAPSDKGGGEGDGGRKKDASGDGRTSGSKKGDGGS